MRKDALVVIRQNGKVLHCLFEESSLGKILLTSMKIAQEHGMKQPLIQIYWLTANRYTKYAKKKDVIVIKE